MDVKLFLSGIFLGVLVIVGAVLLGCGMAYHSYNLIVSGVCFLGIVAATIFLTISYFFFHCMCF